MRPSRIVVTGGAGFVGGNLAVALATRHPELRVVALDNLHRRGSELQLQRLADAGVDFVHGDVRRPADIEGVGGFDLLIECSAEPSVMAGAGADRSYLLETNLTGTIHCVEAALRHRAAVIFLSTSRVYPIAPLEGLGFREAATRFELAPDPGTRGASERGISEDFPLPGARSFYGATKLASELLIQEYVASAGLHALVLRCGLIAGPWQMGRIDQGVAAWWVLNHRLERPLNYIGYGGAGKQVRDFLHVDDLVDLVDGQLGRIEALSGQVFNVGGGARNSASLRELTEACQRVTGREVPIGSVPGARRGDVRIFITDASRIEEHLGWKPTRGVAQVVEDINAWAAQVPEEWLLYLVGEER